MTIDALTMKVREVGCVIKRPVLLTTGVNGDEAPESSRLRGRQIRDLVAWDEFFAHLVARLLIGDRSSPLTPTTVWGPDRCGEAVRCLSPQRCRTYYAPDLMCL